MIKKLLAAIAIISIIAVGVLAYSFFKSPELAGGPIKAIPIIIELQKSSPIQAPVPDTQAGPAVEAPNTGPDTGPDIGPDVGVQFELHQEPTAEMDPVPEAELPAGVDDAHSAEAQSPATTAPTIFEIIQTGSEARFLIDEVLRGEPTTVVGTTDQVAGQFALNPNDLSTTRVGTIQVNARSLTTDNRLRNRAIKNQILLTNDYEFVTFAPTEILGLPESGGPGQTYTFQIVGDLTITNVTQQVTFDVTATPTNETQIRGFASTQLLYTDFELFIPDSPSVDTVDDTVRLELEFVAEAIQVIG
ncbi:MAG TPA: YceI family protein [Anaerolineae bacterium]|jgi:polyisoprenoid-binding protein YceI